MEPNQVHEETKLARTRLNAHCKDLVEVLRAPQGVGNRVPDACECAPPLKYADFLHRSIIDFLSDAEISEILLKRAGSDTDQHLDLCVSHLVQLKILAWRCKHVALDESAAVSFANPGVEGSPAVDSCIGEVIPSMLFHAARTQSSNREACMELLVNAYQELRSISSQEHLTGSKSMTRILIGSDMQGMKHGDVWTSADVHGEVLASWAVRLGPRWYLSNVSESISARQRQTPYGDFDILNELLRKACTKLVQSPVSLFPKLMARTTGISMSGL